MSDDLEIEPAAIRHVRFLTLVIATLGVALFLALLEKELFGTATQRAPSPVGEWRLDVFGVPLTAPRVVAVIVTGAVVLLLFCGAVNVTASGVTSSITVELMTSRTATFTGTVLPCGVTATLPS